MTLPEELRAEYQRAAAFAHYTQQEVDRGERTQAEADEWHNLAALLHRAADALEWRGIESAPEGVPVMLCVEYASGRRRVIRAMRAGEKTLHLSDENDPWDGCLYDEPEREGNAYTLGHSYQSY